MSNTSIKKTVFVVGAGASQEVKLPIGSVLKKTIAGALDFRFEQSIGTKMISGDSEIFAALRAEAAGSTPPSNDVSPYVHASRHIRDAMPQAISIDNFIDAHSGDKRIELCGKLAIVRTILQAEAASSLFVDQAQVNSQLNFAEIESTWFNSFWQLLFGNCRASDLEKRLASVTLIVFNYDRCIEHYLFYAIQNYYQVSSLVAAQLLQRLEIYHPYGTVGSLPWFNNVKNNNGYGAIGYGATPDDPKQLLELAKQIKTFTEGTDNLSSAERVNEFATP